MCEFIIVGIIAEHLSSGLPQHLQLLAQFNI